MSRAIVLGSLVPDPGDDASRRRIFQSIAGASLFKDSGTPALIEPLRALIQEAFPERRPKLLDCFAGGGAIPLEGLRLGCDTTAIDLNPVAHLIQRCMLDYPQRFGIPDPQGRNSLVEQVRWWGEWVGVTARDRVAHLYPTVANGSGPGIWFWARTMRCRNPACGIEIPLVKSWWLARGRQNVWLDVVVTDDELRLTLHTGEPSETARIDRGTVSASTATCPACGAAVNPKEMREYGKAHGFGFRQLATLVVDEGGARSYRAPDEEDERVLSGASDVLLNLEETEDGIPAVPDEEPDPAQYRKFQMMPFGIRPFRGLFTPRQLAVTAVLCQVVREAHRRMLDEGCDSARARAIATYLGLMVDRAADYNSAFCSWQVSRQAMRNTYARQGIAMMWDFTEMNPFADVPGNWAGAVSSVAAAIGRCAETGTDSANVLRGNAQGLDGIPDGYFDAVVVDPPYYDAVQYADLSDFFYVWLKRSVGHLYPELFSTPVTPKSQEIIENYADPKSPAHLSSQDFEERLARAIAEMRRVVKSDGVVTIVFAHTESDAWERLLRALLQAALVVSTSWPMQSEMGSRSTANVSAVLGSSVVLVCRPQSIEQSGYYDEVVRELDQRIAERLVEFEQLGLSGADYLISAIGPAFEVFGRYSSVRRLDDEEVSVAELLALARRTVARHAMRRLLGSEALGSVDDVTLLYLTWRWAYAAARIPVDEAQKLGKAFHIEVDELGGVDGLAETSRESYGLRGPDERKRITLGPVPSLVDVLQLACQLHDSGRRRELAELLASTGYADETAFWAAGRAVAESLPDGNKERTMLVNLLGGREQIVAAAREAQPSEVMPLFDEAGR
jgi:putative DNA methylase